MSVKPEFLFEVFGTVLVIIKSSNLANKWVQAKHCSVPAARTRADCIVVYFCDDVGVQRFAHALRGIKRHHSEFGSWFKAEHVVGTGAIPGLPGVSMAWSGAGGRSFGQRLCNAIADAYVERRRKPTPIGYYELQELALAKLLHRRFDIRRPWVQVRGLGGFTLGSAPYFQRYEDDFSAMHRTGRDMSELSDEGPSGT